jgi:Tol biopolymer transport system component
MRADGRGVVRLAGRGMEPAWSPDGRRIVFSRGDALCAIRAARGAARRITEPGTNGELYAPDWQPRPES